MDLTVVLVTSPSWSDPSLGLIEPVIESLSLVQGLESCAGGVKIVLDGYKIHPTAQTKRGRVTQEMAEAYEGYEENLKSKYDADSRFSILRCPEHLGFAMAVRFGLQHCTTEFALIVQHDRSFVAPFDRLPQLLEAVRAVGSIRYAGFPSVMNCSHPRTLSCRYGLGKLVKEENQIRVQGEEDLKLMPLAFWYDSNHIAHVRRYLDIFAPYTNLPSDLREAIGRENIHELLLRKGDFIEDRFGQAQRKLLTGPRMKEDEDLLRRLHAWFGSYLIWDRRGCSEQDEDASCRVYVGHLPGAKRGGQSYAIQTDTHPLSKTSKRNEWVAAGRMSKSSNSEEAQVNDQAEAD